MTDSVFGTPDADGWYEWKGDGTMRPAGRVEIKLRCGLSHRGSAEMWHWSILQRSPHGGDIVKWRPVQ